MKIGTVVYSRPLALKGRDVSPRHPFVQLRQRRSFTPVILLHHAWVSANPRQYSVSPRSSIATNFVQPSGPCFGFLRSLQAEHDGVTVLAS
jgi:hypothetical protein